MRQYENHRVLLYLVYDPSLKTAGNVSCPNIPFFKVCFLAIAISFLDKLSQFISPFYSRRFPKNSEKNARNPISFNELSSRKIVFGEFREMRTCDINVDP